MTFSSESTDPVKSIYIVEMKDGKLLFADQITPF